LCKFLDIGQRLWIRTTRLRALPEDLMPFPPMAEECSIFDLHAAGYGGEWSEEARDLFLRLVEGKECHLTVTKSRGDVMKVDLLSYNDDGCDAGK
jgi:hypothetical protein